MTEEERFELRTEYIEGQSLASLTTPLVETGIGAWGDPVENREKLIPYGFPQIDKALYGIDPEGEFIVLQGNEKGRKSTALHNILKNIMEWERLKEKPVIVFDILESSSGPDKVKDGLICMVAAEYIMEHGHRSDGYCPQCKHTTCRELQLSTRSLRFITKTQLMKNALNHAIKVVNGWPIYLFGPGLNEGNTRDLQGSIRRWEWMKEHLGALIFIQDHIQQYYFAGRSLTDYEKQQAIIPSISSFVGQHKVVDIALSQLSLATRKEKDGRQYATGGAQAAAEANTVLQTIYDEDLPWQVAVKVVESRYSGKLQVYGRIDPASGLMWGDMSFDPPLPTERAMTEEETKGAPY